MGSVFRVPWPAYGPPGPPVAVRRASVAKGQGRADSVASVSLIRAEGRGRAIDQGRGPRAEGAKKPQAMGGLGLSADQSLPVHRLRERGAFLTTKFHVYGVK